ncbi:MAG: fumarate reductase subunit D [Jiangellaceae bacterium]|nr:fumarate reductase subunit D [Jiangellaceae bacterium]
MRRRRPVEPLVWLLFSGGGVVTAILVPVLLVLLGLAFPLGWIDPPPYEHIHAVLGHWIARIVLLGLCVLGFVHWAHRFRYTLHEGLKLQRLDAQISLLCYGLALIGSVWAVYILLFTG